MAPTYRVPNGGNRDPRTASAIGGVLGRFQVQAPPHLAEPVPVRLYCVDFVLAYMKHVGPGMRQTDVVN